MAWIVATPNSRTVINHSSVEELKAAEVIEKLTIVLDGNNNFLAQDEAVSPASPATTTPSTTSPTSPSSTMPVFKWFHFEGRNVVESEKIAQWINWKVINPIVGDYSKTHRPPAKWLEKTSILSVEFEKPDREGIETLFKHADVCFFSKTFAEGKGFDQPTDFLDKYARKKAKSE